MARYYGSVTEASSLTVASVATSPQGAVGAQDSAGVSYNGYTYLAWVNSSTGDVEVGVVDESTKALIATVALHGSSLSATHDDHDVPALLVRSSDHKLVVAYCAHNGAAMYVRISTTSLTTDPDLGDGFGTETNIDSSLGGTSYTYPTLLELTGEGKIYLFTRDIESSVGYPKYATSSDGGVTWTAMNRLFTGMAAGQSSYVKIATNGTSRIDVWMTDKSPGSPSSPSSVYHAYYTASTWYNSAGTSHGLPLSTSSTTLVRAGGGGEFAMVSGAGYYASEGPVINVFASDSSYVRVYQYRYSAGWTGHLIAAVGGILGSINTNLTGGSAMSLASPDKVWMLRYTTALQVWEFNSSDSGVTWSASVVTSDASTDNFWPTVIRGSSPPLLIAWRHGSWTTDFVWSTDVQVGY